MYDSRAGGQTIGSGGFVGRVGFHGFLPTPRCGIGLTVSAPIWVWVCSAWAWVDGLSANLGLGLLGVGLG